MKVVSRIFVKERDKTGKSEEFHKHHLFNSLQRCSIPFSHFSFSFKKGKFIFQVPFLPRLSKQCYEFLSENVRHFLLSVQSFLLTNTDENYLVHANEPN